MIIPIVGNVKDVLQEFLLQLNTVETRPDPKALASWWKQIAEWRGRDCLKYPTSNEVIKPQAVVQKLWEVTKGDAFITSDVGQHQMWAAQYYGFDKPRRWINSGGLGTMGVGLPYANGRADGQSWCDGGPALPAKPRYRCVSRNWRPASNIT